MPSTLKWKIIFILAIIIVCGFFWYYNGLKLGLDLKGGIHLVLLLDTKPAIQNQIEGDIGSISAIFTEKNIPVPKVYRSSSDEKNVLAEFVNLNEREKGAEIFTKNFPDYDWASRNETTLSGTLKPQKIKDIHDKAMEQALEIIRTRIDKYGVSEPVIQRQGISGDRIVVELPGVENSSEIKKLIGKSALLEWRLTADPKNGAGSIAEILKSYNGNLPPSIEILPGESEKGAIYYAVETRSPITGSDLKKVMVESGNMGQPSVGFVLSPEAGKVFADITTNHTGEPFAIILDKVVISAPNIREPIPNGRGVIEGNFTQEEATRLVNQLKSGSIPALITFAEERTIGPSMGLDSIRRGEMASGLGLILVILFMIIYYRLSGINANVAQFFNLIIIMGVMSTFGMTLTLPGIAGIILTIGMAVDANILVFERIKEELVAGKTVKGALEQGFGRAFTTIFDSNLTTIIAALFLLQFGTGPIKGFAVTLTVGLLASMFTAVYVSHTMFDASLALSRGVEAQRTLSIGPLGFMKGLKIGFMPRKYIWLAISAILVLHGVVEYYSKGLNYGLDFSGGSEIQLKFSNKIDVREIEANLKRNLTSECSVVQAGNPEDNMVIIKVQGRKGKGLLSEDDLTANGQKVITLLKDPEDTKKTENGIIDLNLSDKSTISNLLKLGLQKAEISGTDEAIDKAAVAISSIKAEHKGILSSFEAIKGKAGISDAIIDYLKKHAFFGKMAIQRFETVGPIVGSELKHKAVNAVIGSLIGMLIYIWFRFEFRFGVGAIVALIHDVLVTLGFQVLMGIPFDLTSVAAYLTLVGFSVNDTIVVFDRVRENLKKAHTETEENIFNNSINETLSRTIWTSGTVFLVIIALLVYGGERILPFSFVMTIGTVVGTYSSIFIASPVAIFWNNLGINRLFSGKKKRR